MVIGVSKLSSGSSLSQTNFFMLLTVLMSILFTDVNPLAEPTDRKVNVIKGSANCSQVANTHCPCCMHRGHGGGLKPTIFGQDDIF